MVGVGFDTGWHTPKHSHSLKTGSTRLFSEEVRMRMALVLLFLFNIIMGILNINLFFELKRYYSIAEKAASQYEYYSKRLLEEIQRNCSNNVEDPEYMRCKVKNQSSY